VAGVIRPREVIDIARSLDRAVRVMILFWCEPADGNVSPSKCLEPALLMHAEEFFIGKKLALDEPL
jgi:hypothetical protein